MSVERCVEMYVSFAAVLITCAVSPRNNFTWPSPVRLRVEGLQQSSQQPVVLSEEFPHFSFSHGRLPPHIPRGLGQSAYRIVVQSGRNGTLIWDSGVVNSINTSDIKYGGNTPLLPFEQYVWMVAWLATDGNWSANATAAFEADNFGIICV